MRNFDSGATRDTVSGKLSYVKALSPIVLRRYVEYLGKHRVQADGKLRDWDNWKQGIPKDVYLDSLGRHFVDVWLNEGDIEESLCAVIFNAMGMLFERLNEGKVMKIYISHAIMGAKGMDATEVDIADNCRKASSYTDRLRTSFPRIDFYCPAEHEEFVHRTYKMRLLTIPEILKVDCDIIQSRDGVIALDWGGISNGMAVELQYAMDNCIPSVICKVERYDLGPIIDFLKELNDG